MRHLLTFFLSFMACSLLHAQVPQAFSYQGVARYSDGLCIQDGSISIRISIRDTAANGTILYQEQHIQIPTNSQGLFSLLIGADPAKATGGGLTTDFSSLTWNNQKRWLEVEMDTTGGASFVPVGSQQLMSVPYAFASEQAQYADTATVAMNVLGGAPVGTVQMFWDAGGMLPIPEGWQILDGSIVNDPLSALFGMPLPDMTNRYAVGTVGNTDTIPTGNTNHSINLSHSHTVNSHNHSVSSHSHSMSHTHTSGSYSALFGWDNQGDVGVRKGSFSTYAAWGVSFNDALNTEGNLSFGNVGTSEFTTNTASVDVAGSSGSSSSSFTGTGGGGNTGSASPGTSGSLSSTQSIQPESIGFIYIIKVR